jgi:hypothetical protein
MDKGWHKHFGAHTAHTPQVNPDTTRSNVIKNGCMGISDRLRLWYTPFPLYYNRFTPVCVVLHRLPSVRSPTAGFTQAQALRAILRSALLRVLTALFTTTPM